METPNLPETVFRSNQAQQKQPNLAVWTVGGVVLGLFLPIVMCACLAAISVFSLGSLGGSVSPASTMPNRNSINASYVSGPLTGDAVAIIDVNGTIVSGDTGDLNGFGSAAVAASESIVRAIKAAAKDPSVKAILLKVDSPGGSVLASNEIYNALKKSGKPVVAYMGSIAASGGYYVSMGASHVMAHPDTLTGSIGVISEFTNLEGLYEKLGIKSKIIKSAENKDFGASTVPFTPEDEKLWQVVIDETYASFIDIVAENRKLSKEQVRTLADGRVYTGRQALAAKLVDELGYSEDAIAKAASLGGISGEARVIRFKRQTPFAELFGQSVARSILSGLGIPVELPAVGPALEYR
jgi:protease-4